ncbi:hypothetical protein [Cupriavidus pauculus]|jgi:hypothetical protein|uniref:Secreted protein n=2 Tax=Cupriavidus TaxID=106589 RepID=A0A5P2HCZ4_9BURK|nr:hypothetical protein FOB72_27165 [Cupriavidus pauculus]
MRAASRFLFGLSYGLLLCMPGTSFAEPDIAHCERVDAAQLRIASEETLLFLRCRARRLAYEAPDLKGVSQRTRDDLVFACMDQAEAVEHQLRVGRGYTRESLARKKCDDWQNTGKGG